MPSHYSDLARTASDRRLLERLKMEQGRFAPGQRQARSRPITARDIAHLLAGGPIGMLGMQGDIQNLAAGIRGEGPRSLLTTANIAKFYGLDPNSLPFMVGEFGMPDPSDIGKLSAKALAKLTSTPEGMGLAMTLFHGSPHKFAPTKKNLLGEFDLTKVGTGEGWQSYGWGAYLSERPEVANSYKLRLSRAGDANSLSDEVDLLTVGDEKLLSKYPIEADRDFVNLINDGNKTGASNYAQSRANRWNELKDDPTYQFRDYAAEKADAWTRLKPEIDAGRVENSALGHLYEVDIPDETIDRMLDWDAPLSEQPESVRKALGLIKENDFFDWYDARLASIDEKSAVAFAWDNLKLDQRRNMLRKYTKATGKEAPGHLWARDATGEGAYWRLADELGSDKAASEYLNSLGIPGIKYFDGASRNVVGGDFLGVEKVDGKFRSKVGIKSNTRVQGAPQTITWSPKFDTEAEAKKWADAKINKGTRNIVLFDPDLATIFSRK